MLIGPDGESVATRPAPPPPPHNTSATATSTPAQSSATVSFDHAVQEARVARAAAEGLPPWTHGYETATVVQPGNTLYGIAVTHGDTLPATEADNAQLTNPNFLYPGEAVFTPGQSPVSAATTAQIQAAERFGSRQQWAQVETHIESDLRAQANGKLLPDQVVQPTVKALDQWAIGNDRLRQATQGAYSQVYSEWQKQGITSQQLAPILKDRQAAVQNTQALAHLRAPLAHMLLPGAQAQANQAWSKVQQDTNQWLQSSIGLKAFPEDTATQRVKQLDALFPTDHRFAAANQAALHSATQTWQSLGITHDKLDPVLHAYNAYETTVQQRQQALTNPHLHNEDPTAESLLNQQVNAAQARLQTAIVRQVDSAAQQSQSPQGRSQAMVERAAILQIVGPQTAHFKSAVDAADTEVQVTRPAQTVAAAYRSGGAAAAAQALLTAAKNTSPGFAASIITASRPTIDKIAADLNTMTQNSTTPSGQFTSVYGNLSAAVEQTDHGADPTMLGKPTMQAANQVAAALASHLQTKGTFLPAYGTYTNPGQIYADAAQGAIGNRQGASLSLALSAALQKRGESTAANQVLEGSATGFDELKTTTDSDVQNFAKVTANLEQLRASWGPFMSTAQLNAATAGYAKRNPQFLTQFGQTLSAVQQDGTAIVQARQAFSAYRSSLAGLSNHQDLVDAANNLTGGDKSTFFAVQESGTVTMDVARSLSAKVPGAEAGYSTALDAPGVLRSIRTEVNQFLKSEKTTPGFKPNVVTNLGLSATGLALTTPTALSELQNFNKLDFGGKAVTVYNSLGFSKYLLETGSYSTRLADASGIRYLGAVAQSKVGSWLTSVTSDGTAANTAFKMFGSFYYLTGAFANGVSGEEAASAGDPWSAGLDWGNSVGNVLLAANSSSKVITSALGNLGIDAGEDTAINGALDWAGPIGAGLSVLAQFGLAFHAGLEQKAAQNALQAQGQGFLEDGLHLKSGVAFQLADVSDNQHEGPAGVLLAYAHQYHVQPQSLLDFLNKQNPDDVGSFVYLSEYLTPGKNGQYRATDSSDTANLYYIPGVLYQNTQDVDPYAKPPLVDTPNTPSSLRQLHYWAEAIFPGQSPQPTS